MGLLDLPPELFQKVVQHLISPAGLHRADPAYRKALDYRRVSPAFRDAVDYELVTEWPMTALARAEAQQIVNKNAPTYLLARIRKPLDCDHRFPEVVSLMVDYLCREFNLTNAHSLQACLERVCGGLVRFFTGDRIRRLVWNIDGLMEKGQTRPTLATSVFYEGFYAHKLLASLVFQAYDLVEKLLPGAVDDRTVRWFRHDEMTPLQFAVITNDEKLLDIILQYCSSIDGDLAWDIFAIN